MGLLDPATLVAAGQVGMCCHRVCMVQSRFVALHCLTLFPTSCQAPGAELAAASWKRLGFLTFDSNERTAHSARELKTVGLPGAPAHLLRFLVHRCHENVLNPYNQAGLVALVLMGEPLAGPGGAAPLAPITNTPLASYGMVAPPSMAPYASALQLGATPQLGYLAVQHQQQPYMPPPGAAAAQPDQSSGSGSSSGPATQSAAVALAAELGVDPVTAERIAELQAQKTAAVGREDYDDAKRLKAAVDRLRAVSCLGRSRVCSVYGQGGFGNASNWARLLVIADAIIRLL